MKLCNSWITLDWDELDWARVKDLQLRNLLDKRKEAALAAEQCTCIQCPTFLKHASSIILAASVSSQKLTFS